MASLLFSSTVMHHLCSDRKAVAFFQTKNLGHTGRKITEWKKARTGRVSRCSLVNGLGTDLNGAYSQVENSRTIFRGGLKRAEVKLPGLALRVKVDEVLQGESILELIDLAVTDGVTIVVLEAVGDVIVSGGQLYEAACVLKALLRGRASLLVAERVDIAAAAGASGVLLSDRGLPGIIARNTMQSAGSGSTILPLIARTVRTAQSAQDAAAAEGADLIILVIKETEDAEMLVDCVCQHVSVPVFTMFESLEWSTVVNLSSKLAKAGASGLVIATEHVKHFGDSILNQVKGLISGIKLTNQKSKEHGVHVFPQTEIFSGDMSGNATERMPEGNILDIKAKEVLDEERPLLLEAINVIHEAAPQMEEVSLLVDAVAQLDELFSLVLVGEFNSGKSTVINALLGRRYLKEGVVPTTNEITVLCYSGDGFYGEERSERHPDGHFIRYLPASLLKQMRLVDTPGTNVILQRQQRLTEEFVPRADLVLFVISADRALTESEVKFLHYVRQWGKKIIFILNKSDIFEDSNELKETMRFVKENAQQLLSIEEIILYPVSARSALEAKIAAMTAVGATNIETLSKDPKWRTSGFCELENFIFSFLDGSTDNGAERIRLKLETPIGIATALFATCERQLLAEITKVNGDLLSIKESIGKLKQYQETMENDSTSRRKQILSVIEAANQRAENFIDSILRISNVEVAAEYILRGDRSGSLPVSRRFESEVIGSALLDIQKLLEEYQAWLKLNNARQERRFRELFANQWPSLANPGEPNIIKEKMIEKRPGCSMEVLEDFNVRAAALLLEQEIREVIIGTFGGLGAAGLSASVLTSVLPTTAEDLIALGLCSAGGLLGVRKLPQRRIEIKKKAQRISSSFAQQLEAAMQSDLEQAIRDAENQVDLISKPYHDAMEFKANRLGNILTELEDVERKLQTLQLKVQNLCAS